MAGQPVRYAFSGIANTSNVSLSNFYWRDTLPAQVRLDTVVTGTYNRLGTYKIVYRVNGGDYRTLADNLSTQKNYTLAASATALKLASNERVTEIMFVFGQAPAGFAQVEKPYLHCRFLRQCSRYRRHLWRHLGTGHQPLGHNGLRKTCHSHTAQDGLLTHTKTAAGA